MQRLILFLTLIACLLAAPIGAAGGARSDGLAIWRQMPPVRLEVLSPDGSRHELQAKQASRPAERAQGMQYLDSEQIRSHPIWFVIAPPQAMTWHMHHVPLALDIAFIDANHRVVAVQRMEPEKSGYGIGRPIAFALEVAAGQAHELGLEQGATVRAID